MEMESELNCSGSKENAPQRECMALLGGVGGFVEENVLLWGQVVRCFVQAPFV